jgi:glycerol uptake facilitator-like aquaporin
VTLARAASNTFAGIRPQDAPGFIAAQLLGAAAAVIIFKWLFSAHGQPITPGHKNGEVAPGIRTAR